MFAGRRMRVLFVAEAVTLAQVVRLATLAAGLDPDRYDVHFACAEFEDMIFRTPTFVRWKIGSISKERVERAVAAGRRPYDESTLARYVEEELRLLDAIAPDVVVGDLRMSLSTSTALRGVPYAALINAYWSPYAVRAGLPMPDHPIVKLLGPRLAERYFPVAAPRVFEHFAAPVNAVRKRYGLSRIGSLLEVLTHGDYTLHPDVPALVPTRALPASHVFLGPVLWSPAQAPPPFFAELPGDRPSIYVTFGSSGKVDLLPKVLEGLADLDASIIVATAGRARGLSLPKNAYAADFVPGDLAARRSALVVSNGGSSTGYQALSEGTPVLGIPWNLDQYLATAAIEATGAGRMLRAGSATAADVRDAAAAMLADGACRRAAAGLASELGRWNPHLQLDALFTHVASQRGGLARAPGGVA